MEKEVKTQPKKASVDVLLYHLAQGVALPNAAKRAGLSLKESIKFLQTRKEVRSVEPEVLSEIAHQALENGLKSLIEIAETCMIPQVRAMAAVELCRMGTKLKEMSGRLDTGLSVPVESTNKEDSMWKF